VRLRADADAITAEIDVPAVTGVLVTHDAVIGVWRRRGSVEPVLHQVYVDDTEGAMRPLGVQDEAKLHSRVVPIVDGDTLKVELDFVGEKVSDHHVLRGDESLSMVDAEFTSHPKGVRPAADTQRDARQMEGRFSSFLPQNVYEAIWDSPRSTSCPGAVDSWALTSLTMTVRSAPRSTVSLAPRTTRAGELSE
jgi:hypothetical protein